MVKQHTEWVDTEVTSWPEGTDHTWTVWSSQPVATYPLWYLTDVTLQDPLSMKYSLILMVDPLLKPLMTCLAWQYKALTYLLSDLMPLCTLYVSSSLDCSLLSDVESSLCKLSRTESLWLTGVGTPLSLFSSILFVSASTPLSLFISILLVSASIPLSLF